MLDTRLKTAEMYNRHKSGIQKMENPIIYTVQIDSKRNALNTGTGTGSLRFLFAALCNRSREISD